MVKNKKSNILSNILVKINFQIILICILLIVGIYYTYFNVFNAKKCSSAIETFTDDDTFVNNTNINGLINEDDDDIIPNTNDFDVIDTTLQNNKQNPKNMIDDTLFDRYVINLEKNKDRMLKFQRSYNMSDLINRPVIRINAVYGKDIQYKKYIDENADPKFKSPGMVGCFLSHLDTYKKFQNSDKPYALIFEDDAKINPQIYKNTIAKLHTQIPDDWDIILLGYMLYDPTHKYEVHDSYIKMLHFWGTHGYIINKKSVEKILVLMQPPFHNQIDHVMSKHARTGALKIYGTKDVAVWQNASYSDVQ